MKVFDEGDKDNADTNILIVIEPTKYLDVIDAANVKTNILLMNKPTNHLNVINVAWAKRYLHSLTDVTAIIVLTQACSTTASSTQ